MKIKLLILLMTMCFISCLKEREEIINNPPIIIKFYEDVASIGSSLTIIGENFSRYNENNIIEFGGGIIANPYSWKHGIEDTLEVIIPEGTQTGEIAIEVYSKRVVSDEVLYIAKGNFKKMASLPISKMNGIAFSINGKGYVGLGTNGSSCSNSGDIWEYDPNTGEWMQKNFFAGSPRCHAFSFVINNKAYVGGGGFTDFFGYDSESDTWDNLADFPSGQNRGCTAFALNNKGYVIGGSSSNLVFEYNPEIDEWEEKYSFFNSFAIGDASNFVINNTAYVGTGSLESYLWQYDPDLDIWNNKADAPLNIRTNAVGFTLEGKGYFTNGNSQFDTSPKCLVYDPLADSWALEVNFPGMSQGNACSFVIDDNAYIVGGIVKENNGSNTVTDECWKFQAN